MGELGSEILRGKRLDDRAVGSLTNAGLSAVVESLLDTGGRAASVASAGLVGKGEGLDLAEAEVHVGLSAGLSIGVVHDAEPAGVL